MPVGLAGGELKMSPSVYHSGIPFETKVVIAFWGTRAELREVIALARAGRIGLIWSDFRYAMPRLHMTSCDREVS